MKFGKKDRDWSEIKEDPRTPYMMGRLLGANEMAIILLLQENNETAKHVAGVLARVCGFFMETITKTEAQQLEDAPTLVIKQEHRG